MPLLRKKPFEKKKPPPNLQPDEEVFHCKLTNELFRDYDEFYERIILCNSLIWSCSITGKPNITYAEALRSESSAKETLKEYPKELKLPVIYLASKTRRTCLRDLADDVYNYIRNRYFAGEIVEVNLTDGHWYECQILNVIAPSLNELDEYTAVHGERSHHNATERDFWPPAVLYQYEVRDLSDRHTEDVKRFHCVKADKVRRRKGSFTRERNRLFLRQIAVPFESGLWGIKEDFIIKHQITHARYLLLFPGPVPAFHDSSKKGRIPPSPSKMITNGKTKSPRKSSLDTYLKSPTKDSNKKLKPMDLQSPPSGNKLKNGPGLKEHKVRSRKRKLKDAMKGSQLVTEEGVGPKKKRLIQQKLTAQVMSMGKMKRNNSENARPIVPKPLTEEEKQKLALIEKQKRMEERSNKRQMIREEKRRLAEHLKEWNKPREDLECEDLKLLPAPSAVQCRIPNQLFGDFLMVLEFISCFTSIIRTEDYFPGGLSFDHLEKALVEKEGTEVFADIVQLLLSSLFKLQEQEDDEVHETEGQAIDLDMAGSTDITRDDAVQAATAAISWCQAYQGIPLKKLTLDCATLSELVRLHILTSGGRCGEKSAKWRYQQRGGYTNFDDPGLMLRLEEPQILRALSVKNIFDLPLGCKLKILTCLVDQILTYAAVRDVVDDSVEKLKLAKLSYKHQQAFEIKLERDAAAARRKKRKEDKQKLKEGGVVEEVKQEPESPKRDEGRRKIELQKKEKDLQDALATYRIFARSSPLGRDRAYRRFWTFHSIPGLFVEDNEEWAGSCLSSPTPHNPALALANDQEEALACVQRLFEERGGNGSDKENEGSERGLANSNKKPSLSAKNKPEMLRNPLIDRAVDSRAGSDVEEEAELNVKLANHLVCLSDSKSCQVHSPFLPRTKWAFFSREAELDALVGALNPRGLREGHLRQVLVQQRNRILGSMSKCPVHKLDHNKKPTEIMVETRKSSRSKKDTSNFNFSSDLPIEEVFELTLRDYILDMEEKISMGGFGNLKVKNRDLWREAINKGHYDQQCDKLVWGNKEDCKILKASASDKNVTKIKTEGKTSRPDTPDSTSISSDGGVPSYEDPGGHLSILKIEEEDQEDEVDSGVTMNGSSDSLTVKPVVKQLASAILQVAQCIEHRYLKKPLGEDQKSLEKRLKALANKKKLKEEEAEEGFEDGRGERDDIMTSSSPMERWETSLMASTSLSQLYLHFYTLDNSIQWSKSALYARCRVCRKQGDGENMLLCDGCNKGYHLYCLKPRLDCIPLGDWFCPACRPAEKIQPPRKSRRLFSEESDDEANQVDEENEDDEEEESEEGSIHNETCHKCGIGGHVICCDTCPFVFHMECTDPPLRKVPRGTWSCPKCRPQNFANPHASKRESSPSSPQQLPLSEGGLHFPWREGRRRRWGDEWQGWGQGTGPWWDDGSTSSRRRQCATAAVAKISSIAKRLRSNSWDESDSTYSSEDRTKKTSSRRRRTEEPEEEDEDDLETRRKKSASMRGQRRMRRSEIFDGVPAPLDLDVLESLLADITRHDDAWPFLRPVLKSEAPDYHVIIKRPMDFGTMKYKLKIMEYKNNNEFLADALLVFENCQMYNNNSTPEYKAGVRLSRYFERRCKELELTLHEVERGNQNERTSRRC